MSKESRLAAKKRVKQAKRGRVVKRLVITLVVIALLVVAGLIARAVVLSNIEKNAAQDSYLKDDGTIDVSSAKDYVDVCDYKNIKINKSDYLPTESELETAVNNVLTNFTETVTEVGTEIGDDSTIALSYTVTVDGTALDDYAATSTSYTLGSAKYTEEFDTNLAALTVGDDFLFDITFASDYEDTNLAGKTATFSGNIESVNVVPELTDEWVAENMTDYMADSDYPLTATGLKDFCAYNLYQTNLETYVKSYIVDNTTIKKIAFIEKYPFFYTWAQYYIADDNYESYVEYYNSMYGIEMYSEPYELLGLENESEYKKQLKTVAKATALQGLGYQAIYEDAGLEALTQEELEAFCTDTMGAAYADVVESYTDKYLKQLALQDKVLDYVMGEVQVNEDVSTMWVADPVETEETEE